MSCYFLKARGRQIFAAPATDLKVDSFRGERFLENSNVFLILHRFCQ